MCVCPTIDLSMVPSCSGDRENSSTAWSIVAMTWKIFLFFVSHPQLLSQLTSKVLAGHFVNSCCAFMHFLKYKLVSK